MCNFLLCIVLMFNTLNVKVNISGVEKIEYYSSDTTDNSFYLNVYLNSTFKDVVELTVYFYNSNKKLDSNKYYSSALNIDGRKRTQAKIPYKFKEKIYLNIVIYSGNLEKEIENIMFPIYPRNDLICDLSEKRICESSHPVFVEYKNKKIIENNGYVSLINDKLNFSNFNNLIPINKIHIISNSLINKKEGYAVLKLKNNEKVFCNEEFFIPLETVKENDVIYLEFLDKYYVDMKNGITSKNYINNSFYVNQIILPYIDYKYEFSVEILGEFSGFEKVLVEFTVETKHKLVGECNESKYCIRRSYL